MIGGERNRKIGKGEEIKGRKCRESERMREVETEDERTRSLVKSENGRSEAKVKFVFVYLID